MRTCLFAVAVAATIATPALARDGSGYIGVEGGALFAKDMSSKTTIDGTVLDPDVAFDYKTGLDIDLIGGYDFGMVRAEAEFGWKRAKHNAYTFIADEEGPFDADGKTTVTSVMANALADFGNEDGISFFAGGGVGWARTRTNRSEVGSPTVDRYRRSGFAWQLIAGARYPVTSQIDLGLKYRYFDAGKSKHSFDFDGLSGVERLPFRSHSVLVSVIYNVGSSR